MVSTVTIIQLITYIILLPIAVFLIAVVGFIFVSNILFKRKLKKDMKDKADKNAKSMAIGAMLKSMYKIKTYSTTEMPDGTIYTINYIDEMTDKSEEPEVDVISEVSNTSESRTEAIKYRLQREIHV